MDKNKNVEEELAALVLVSEMMARELTDRKADKAAAKAELADKDAQLASLQRSAAALPRGRGQERRARLAAGHAAHGRAQCRGQRVGERPRQLAVADL